MLDLDKPSAQVEASTDKKTPAVNNSKPQEDQLTNDMAKIVVDKGQTSVAPRQRPRGAGLLGAPGKAVLNAPPVVSRPAEPKGENFDIKIAFIFKLGFLPFFQPTPILSPQSHHPIRTPIILSVFLIPLPTSRTINLFKVCRQSRLSLAANSRTTTLSATPTIRAPVPARKHLLLKRQGKRIGIHSKIRNRSVR